MAEGTGYLYSALGHTVIDRARDEVTVCTWGTRGWLILENGLGWTTEDYRAELDREPPG